MEQKEMLGLKIVTNFGTFAEFHAIASQKLDKLRTEDEKLKMLEMVKFIYQNVLDEILHSAVNEAPFNPCLGHFISTLINIAIADKYFKVKNNVIEIVDLIINRLTDYYKRTRKGFNTSDLLAAFLPGISQFLMKMITKDEKQNKIVYINALKALASLFVSVYRDYEVGLSEPLESYPFLRPRNAEWQTKSIEKLNIVVELIERSLIKHQSVEVREALIIFATILVFHIVDHSENHDLLPLISRNLFRIPLTLLYDEHEFVQQLSLSFTRRVSTKFTFQNAKVFTLEEQLIDDLWRLLDDLAKELSVYSEETILNNLKLLCGYLNCLEEGKLDLLLTNQKDKLFDLLKLIYRLDFNRMSANLLPKEQTQFSNIDFFEKKFVYFDSKRVLSQLDVLCSLIKIKLSDQNVLNDYVIECLSEVAQRKVNGTLALHSDQLTDNGEWCRGHRSTSLLILSYLVKPFDTNPLNLQIISRLVDLLEGELSEIDNDQLYTDERFERTVFCALLIELITHLAFAIGENEKRQYFIITLYSLMACTGSTYLPIQMNAKASIVKLTQIFAYHSVKELIFANMDHVISKIHIKLNNFNDKENLYFVFKIIFECTDANVCGYFDQTLNNLLIAMDINYSIVNFERLARILHLIVRTFKRCFVKQDDEPRRTRSHAEFGSVNLDEFRTELFEFCRTKERNKEELKMFEQELREPVDERFIAEQQKKIEQEELNHAQEEAAKEEETKQLPIHIDYTKRILERCSNFLSYNLIQVRLIVLDMMVNGLDVLKSHEGDNFSISPPLTDALLPTAHIIWESLVHRFKDEQIVLFKCTECLTRLAVTCGDFIRSRTIKQVLPQIYSFLKLNRKRSLLNQSTQTCQSNANLNALLSIDSDSSTSSGVLSVKNSAGDSIVNQSVKHSSNAFYYSLDYRLQLLLLDQLGRLAFNIRLSRKDLWPLIASLVAYLDIGQPIELRLAAEASVREIEHLDFYAVYYFRRYHASVRSL